ncbi:MAG: hypothetical protein EOM67_15045, partial [Spirochaetia bacterium]|nr:hypothetical protein [Spirochaetia bacterium]
MKVTAYRITGTDLLRTTCESTMHSPTESKMTRLGIYNCEHSPIRSQMFTIKMEGIPSFVSVHLVRHNVGVQHFVQTMRNDRGAEDVANRNTPVNHTMIANAQAIIDDGALLYDQILFVGNSALIDFDTIASSYEQVLDETIGNDVFPTIDIEYLDTYDSDPLDQVWLAYDEEITLGTDHNSKMACFMQNQMVL